MRVNVIPGFMCRNAPKFSHEFKIGKHRVLLVECRDGLELEVDGLDF